MTNHNGTPFDFAQDALPDYLLIYSPETGWYLTDRHGNLFLTKALIRPAAMVDMLREAGASYQIIDPRQRIEEAQEKGNP